ncbi:capsular polysaccharide synthesis protein [Corynebacterium phoceense]
MVDQRPTVWLYWDDPDGGAPGYIALCREAIEKAAKPFEVVILNKDNAHEYIANLFPRFGEISTIAHRADYIRAACLAENGGIWLDIDTVPVAPLSIIWSLVPTTGAVFYGWKPYEPSIGMIAAEKNHPVLTTWRSQIEHKLEEGLEQRWAGIGYDILWPLVKRISYTHIPRESCAPLHYTQTGVFGEKLSLEDIAFSNTLMVQLYNRGLSGRMGSLSSDELMSEDCLLSNLLHYAFDNEIASEEIHRNLCLSVAPSSAAVRSLVAPSTLFDGRHLLEQAINVANLSRINSEAG